MIIKECFVDKGRQMSVMMGNKDLCTNLKLQEKKKRFYTFCLLVICMSQFCLIRCD